MQVLVLGGTQRDGLARNPELITTIAQVVGMCPDLLSVPATTIPTDWAPAHDLREPAWTFEGQFLDHLGRNERMIVDRG